MLRPCPLTEGNTAAFSAWLRCSHPKKPSYTAPANGLHRKLILQTSVTFSLRKYQAADAKERMQIFTDEAKAGALPDIVFVGAADQQMEIPGCLRWVPAPETDPANPGFGSKAFSLG